MGVIQKCETIKGRDDTLSHSHDDYTRVELLEVLARSDEDVKYGRVRPAENTFDDLRKTELI